MHEVVSPDPLNINIDAIGRVVELPCAEVTLNDFGNNTQAAANAGDGTSNDPCTFNFQLNTNINVALGGKRGFTNLGLGEETVSLLGKHNSGSQKTHFTFRAPTLMSASNSAGLKAMMVQSVVPTDHVNSANTGGAWRSNNIRQQ